MENQQEPQIQELIIRVTGDEVEAQIKGDVVTLSSALASSLSNENAASLRAIVELGLMLSKNANKNSLKEALEELDKD